MRTAGVLYRLCSEEEVLGRGIVVLPVLGRAVTVGFLAGRVFEEENYSVDGGELVEEGGLEGYQFFELDVFDAEIIQQEGEDTLLDVSGDWKVGRFLAPTASDSTMIVSVDCRRQRHLVGCTCIPPSAHLFECRVKLKIAKVLRRSTSNL